MNENNYGIRKKRILFTVIIITLLAIAALYASLNPHVRQWISYHSEPSDAFIEQVSRLYENPDYCTITDEEGNDISETFYSDRRVISYEYINILLMSTHPESKAIHPCISNHRCLPACFACSNVLITR